jgi:signal peptidase I
VRLPVINKKIIANNDPQRGDVMVFRYPKDTSTDYIKRVVGLPGDEIAFREQKLYVNGHAVPLVQLPAPGFYDEDSLRYYTAFTEKFGEAEHRILVNPQSQPYYGPEDKISFPFRENCRYSAEGVDCKVPAGHYFMMGDNRDNSQDSRFWGFVPDANIVGRAFFVWMNFGNLKRIGPFQ